MTDAPLWWLAAGILVVAELLTGTFYLLMLSLGLAAGAVAAHAGLANVPQIVTAAVIGGGAVLAWHLLRGRRAADEQAAGANRDVNLDVGETVHIESWGGDGTASVKYRGALWTAMPVTGRHPEGPGAYRIAELRGNQLIVEKILH